MPFTLKSYTICINIRCVITDTVYAVSSVMVLVCSFHSSCPVITVTAFLYQGNQQHGLLIFPGLTSLNINIHEEQFELGLISMEERLPFNFVQVFAKNKSEADGDNG